VCLDSQAPEPEKNILDSDCKFVKNEMREVLLSVLHHIENTSFCVNNFSSEYSIDRKPEQLKLANKAGLLIPDSIITNSPYDARNFVKKVGGKCIYKTLTPHVWDNSDNNTLSIARATLVNQSTLQDDFTIRSCPLLLQEYINKMYDVRVTIMGEFMNAIAFISKDGQPPVDWRPAYQQSTVDLQEIMIPESVKHKISIFMKTADLVFGTVDFSVDKNGKWWFLEINTQGQFLWTEQEKNLGLLENFCHFLKSKDPNFEGVKNAGSTINHKRFMESKLYKSFLNNGSEPQDLSFYSMEE